MLKIKNKGKKNPTIREIDQISKELQEQIDNYKLCLSPQKIMDSIIIFQKDGLNKVEIENKLRKEIFDFYNKKLNKLQKTYKLTTKQAQEIEEILEIIKDFNNNPKQTIDIITEHSTKLNFLLDDQKETEITISKIKKTLEQVKIERQREELLGLIDYDQYLEILNNSLLYYQDKLKKIQLNINEQQQKKTYKDIKGEEYCVLLEEYVSTKLKKYIDVLSPKMLSYKMINLQNIYLNYKYIDTILKRVLFICPNDDLIKFQQTWKNEITEEQHQQINETLEKVKYFTHNFKEVMAILERYAFLLIHNVKKEYLLIEEIDDIESKLDLQKRKLNLNIDRIIKGEDKPTHYINLINKNQEKKVLESNILDLQTELKNIQEYKDIIESLCLQEIEYKFKNFKLNQEVETQDSNILDSQKGCKVNQQDTDQIGQSLKKIEHKNLTSIPLALTSAESHNKDSLTKHNIISMQKKVATSRF